MAVEHFIEEMFSSLIRSPQTDSSRYCFKN